MTREHGLSVRRSCSCIGISRAAYYRPVQPNTVKDAEVIEAINGVIERHGRWGFWKCYRALRSKGHPWNHKKVYRVYRSLGLNHKRRAKRRLPRREKRP